MPNGGEPVTSNDEHREAEYTEVDYITSRSNLNDINEKTQQRRERLNDDVSERNAADETDGSKNFDSSDPPVFPKNQKRLPESSQSQGKLQTLRKVIRLLKSLQKVLQLRGMILSGPKYLKTVSGR